MPLAHKLRLLLFFVALLTLGKSALAADSSQTHKGYYTAPSIHSDTIVFVSEGDLWRVSIAGGSAQRLTSGPGIESAPRISPDGKTIAFRADYEGPRDVYTIPIDGGQPKRETWNGDARPVGWTPAGLLMISTERYSGLPDSRIAVIDKQGSQTLLPLAQSAQAAYDATGALFFTRWNWQGSSTKRYKGGTAEQIWRYDGKGEATPLSTDYEGTSRQPMPWKNRIYFVSDRDGIMNIWSMDPDGNNKRQESHQKFFDVEGASLSDGKIVYASGADLWLLDLASGNEAIIPITILSDFEQMREHWVKKPADYLTAAHISPDGSAAVLTTRGEVFNIPAQKGRIVSVATDPASRFIDAQFTPDGKSIFTLSTKTGETEFWKYPANGIGPSEQWTNDATDLRWGGTLSPDGKWLAHTNKDQELWLYDIEHKKEKKIATSLEGNFSDLNWSDDSRWLAYSETAANQFTQIKVLNIQSGKIETITSDRFNSISPSWSADGKWLYFLSDRNLKSTITAPWGPREPEPHFDKTLKLYQLALVDGLRSPFLPSDELNTDKKDDKKEEKKKEEAADDKKSDKKKSDSIDDKKSEAKDEKKDDKKPAEVKIDFNGLATRLTELPAPAGNFNNLAATADRLCWLSSSDDSYDHLSLQCLDIANKGDDVDTVLSDVKGFEISADRKKILARKGDDLLILDASAKGASLGDPKALAKATLDLSHWSFSVNPRVEYHSIFDDAWRLERDYFYDKKMHGVDWKFIHDRYAPLVDRVNTREELNTVIAQMVSELSALHTFVFGGDARKAADHIDLASFGAVLTRDQNAGGFLVSHIYANDPDLPNTAAPFARPESLVLQGEVITSIDGIDTLTVPDERALLRGKVGQQVLIKVKNQKGESRDLIVKPIDAHLEDDLRYNEWEYTRRLAVEKASDGHIGYVHLRAMGPEDIAQWARDFYPAFDKQGLIIDVRHNNGGNIDSWLLSKLLRQVWFYWQPRVGNPSWNMQYAFRGHLIVLCDEGTASDGEAFSEGFRRLGLGKVIGTRTWGGEIWLSMQNRQADGGIASASETGVYSPEGKWLIEGHGVEPDVVVDNLPVATATGSDAQLQAALAELKKQITADPRPVPQHPAYPDKSFHYQQ